MLAFVVLPRSKRKSWKSQARTAPGVKTALKQLGSQIHALRTERNQTQEALAERARLDAKHLGEIERGVTNPTVATLVGIARALKVPIGRLFHDAES